MGYDKSTRSAAQRVPGVGGAGVDDDDDDGLEYVGGESEDARRARSKTEEMERKLRALSRRHDIYDLLSRSLAPSIWEMEDVKKGILLQLFAWWNQQERWRSWWAEIQRRYQCTPCQRSGY